jgi:hypothetical protein
MGRPEQLDQPGRRLGDGVPEAFLDRGDPPVQDAEVGDQVDGELPAGPSWRRLWQHPAQQPRCRRPGRAWGWWGADRPAGHGAGSGSECLSAGPDQVVAAIQGQPQHGRVVLEADLSKIAGRGRNEPMWR